MDTKTVLVHYDGLSVLTVKPEVVVVDLDDAIEFKREDPLPRVGKFRLKFREKQFFHTDNGKFAEHGNFDEDDGLLRVGNLLHLTTYDCELRNGNVVIATSKAGGAVDPVPNFGKNGK
jgi:hypothetical protein